ncbi:JAB domain-containing protein [Cetobacterium sp.]|uniref:JAB domain-containing protein n=1 Tax=Cetobacterium sp. TaxID=2071632 RepID=UPI003F6711BB
MFYPRFIIEKAILSKAKGVIFVHNHPSDNLTPSKKDSELILEIQELLDKVDENYLTTT